MKTKFFKLHISLLLVCSFAIAQAAVQSVEGYTQIECSCKPLSKSSKKKITRPHLPIKEGTSSNWSGYVSATSLTKPASNAVTEALGTWVVPALSKASHTTYSSIWVGIDGYNSNTIEQIGTEHDWVNGKQQNYAWFEMYPAYPYEITGFPVNVGDSISGLVQYVGKNTFTLSIYNNTKKVYFIVPASYTKSTVAKRSSAEWIVEAPYENGVLPLSHFGTVNFTNCVATINGVTGPINDHLWQYDALTMALNNSTLKAVPSKLSPNGENFSVTWYHE